MMCGVESHLLKVMPSTITTSSNGPLRSNDSDRDDTGMRGHERTEINNCSSSSPSKHQDLDKPIENTALSESNDRRRNSDVNVPPLTPGIPHPQRPVSSLNDDLGSSDEVKIFKDEDDRDGNNSESHQAELLAEKSSLITESEQERGSSSPHPGGEKEHGLCGLVDGIGSVSAGDLSLAGKFFDTSFGMGYLMSPYAAAYANGLTNGSHMVRSSGSPLSPFLYAATAGASSGGVSGDPMSSPPPAHMGTYLDKSSLGLRPPIYPLPTSQYPYAMLGADQLAACPMSHFSSPTGLLSHPGLSSSGQLPHLKQEFSGKDSGGHLKSKYLKKKEPHIKKPLNAFMIYMKDMRPVVQQECTLKESAAINQLLGRRWHGLTREEQAKYYEKARVERQKHMQMYPHWNARDNYRFGTKKKKRTKREKAIEASKDNSMKKCRARFGLEQHNLWCKPCRRKKKCIRLLMQSQGHASSDNYHSGGASGSSKDGSNKSDPLGRQHNSHAHHSQRMLDPNPSINELRRLIPTIGMERGTRDGSFTKVIHSPADSTSQSTGFDTNSETSVRSPSGLSSLPSIGSPSSITSPPTTASSSYYEPNIPYSLLSSNSGNHDWFRPNSRMTGTEIPSAFKPLSTASTFPASSSAAAYRVTDSPKQFSATSDISCNNYPFTSVSGSSSNILNTTSFNNSIMNVNTNSNSVISSQSQNNRTRVGADPRDAKNPLSISQLTGNINADNQPPCESGNSEKDFINFRARASMNGLTDIVETNNRDRNSRRNSVSDKLHRTFSAERVSSLIV